MPSNAHWLAVADQLVSSRVFEVDDAPFIRTLSEAATAELRPERGGVMLFDVDRPLLAARDERAGNSALVVVGLIDDVVVGFARGQIFTVGSRRVASVDDLFVHPAARGVGVGASMLGLIRAWAGENDCSHLESQVLPGNREAKNFFERMGMVTRRMQVSTEL